MRGYILTAEQLMRTVIGVLLPLSSAKSSRTMARVSRIPPNRRSLGAVERSAREF